MSNVQKFLLTVGTDQERARAIAQDAATALESQQTTLIDVVQSLGKYINDEDATTRSRAVEYLSQVIGALPPTFLSRQQIQVLCQFLSDRIEDGGAVGGLQKLQRMERFNGELAVMTFRAIIEHFRDLATKPQSQRLQVLELLNALMFRHRNALKDMGNESIVGITDLVSGEKDPRNLMVIFSILKVVMVEWDISGHTETLFDSVFCYFPITFRPPPDDPYGITAQDLKARLRECIAASGYFAPYAFSQLIDKLDSTSPNVKKDVLQTITACVSSYGLTTVANYAATLWDSLKYEILNVQEEDLATEALVALRAIAARLSEGQIADDPKLPLARYLRPITKECNEQLQEPQHKQAKTCGQILSGVGAASPVAFLLIIKAVMPSLSTLYQDADGIAKQRALLEVLAQLLDTAITIFGTPSMPDPPPNENPLVPFKDRLFEVSSQALMSTSPQEVSFRVIAGRILLRLCMLRTFLQESEIGMAVQYFDEIILSADPTGRDDLKKEAIQALVELSRIKPSLIMDITFPAFMARLPDSCPADNQEYLVILEGLAQLSTERFVSDTLIRRLLNKLNILLETDGPPQYPQAILATLQYILAQRDLTQDPNLQTYFEKIVMDLTTRAVQASAAKRSATALNDETTLEILGRLTTMIVRALDEHKQLSVALQIYSLFTEAGAFVPVPFRANVQRLERSTMILSASLMAAVPQKTILQFTDTDDSSVQSLLSELVRIALIEDVAPIRQSVLRQIGLLTNKFLPTKDVSYATDTLKNLLTGLAETTSLQENTIRTVYWISKALVLRLASTEEVLESLLGLLSNNHCGLAAARGFGLLLSPDEILAKGNGATIRLLAKQKVFSICVPIITAQFPNASTALKANYLIALSGLLKYMPTSIVLSEISTILPLLLQSLDLADADVKAATIQTLAVVSHESPKAIEGHVGSLVGRLLKAATTTTTDQTAVNTTSVRYHALRCLRLFPGKVKESELLPYRNSVTRGLMAALDDGRRAVRREAVECRAVWFNMDEPGSE